MPTFFDSTVDAAEASEALRGLAHASRAFDQHAQMYGVIGDLSSGMRSLPPRQRKWARLTPRPRVDPWSRVQT
ncbi:hypothetical protein SAMN05428934_107144 [Tessaracoccus flavus]|nr:hypothetical protein SAMN05428934_107144 [Tessaracoccus flavus]